MRFLHILHYHNGWISACFFFARLADASLYFTHITTQIIYNWNAHFQQRISFGCCRCCSSSSLLFVSLMIKIWRSKDEWSVKTDTDRKKNVCVRSRYRSSCRISFTIDAHIKCVRTQNFIKSLMANLLSPLLLLFSFFFLSLSLSPFLAKFLTLCAVANVFCHHLIDCICSDGLTDALTKISCALFHLFILFIANFQCTMQLKCRF